MGLVFQAIIKVKIQHFRFFWLIRFSSYNSENLMHALYAKLNQNSRYKVLAEDDCGKQLVCQVFTAW